MASELTSKQKTLLDKLKEQAVKFSEYQQKRYDSLLKAVDEAESDEELKDIENSL